MGKPLILVVGMQRLADRARALLGDQVTVAVVHNVADPAWSGPGRPAPELVAVGLDRDGVGLADLGRARSLFGAGVLLLAISEDDRLETERAARELGVFYYGVAPVLDDELGDVLSAVLRRAAARGD